MEDKILPTRENNEQSLTNMNKLDLSPSELAHRLSIWGDGRKIQTIIRSIQRMKSNEISMSGEMKVIVNMLLARQRDIDRFYSDIEWKESMNGVVSAVVDNYVIALHPYRGGRWVVNVTHPTGFCPPWPKFPKTLLDAQRKALLMIEDTKAFFSMSELE